MKNKIILLHNKMSGVQKVYSILDVYSILVIFLESKDMSQSNLLKIVRGFGTTMNCCPSIENNVVINNK